MIISEESEIFEEENENSKTTSIIGANEQSSDEYYNNLCVVIICFQLIYLILKKNEQIAEVNNNLLEAVQNNYTASPSDNSFNIFKIILNIENVTKQNAKLTEYFAEPFELNKNYEEDQNIFQEKQMNQNLEQKENLPQSTDIQEAILSEQEKELLQAEIQVQQDPELEEQKRLLIENQNELYKLMFVKNEQKQEVKEIEFPCRNSQKFFSFADQLPKPDASSEAKQTDSHLKENDFEKQKETAKQQEDLQDEQDQQKNQLKISDLEASEETNEGIKTKKSEESEHHHLQSLLHADIFGQSSQNLLDQSKNYEILTLSDCNSLVTKKCFSLFLSNQEQSILEEQEIIKNSNESNQFNDHSVNKKLIQLKVYNEHNQKLKHKQKNTKFMNNQNLKLKCKLSLMPLIQKQKQQIQQIEAKQKQQNNAISLTKKEQIPQKSEDLAINFKAKQQSLVKAKQLSNFSSFKCMPKNYINFIESSIKNYDEKKTKTKTKYNKILQNQSEIVLENSENKQTIIKLKQSFDDKENQFLLNKICQNRPDTKKIQKKQINVKN